jgi:hypothetical protein
VKRLVSRAAVTVVLFSPVLGLTTPREKAQRLLDVHLSKKALKDNGIEVVPRVLARVARHRAPREFGRALANGVETRDATGKSSIAHAPSERLVLLASHVEATVR